MTGSSRISTELHSPPPPELVVWDDEHLRVVREHACFRALSWRCVVAVAPEWGRLVEHLTAGRWRDTSRLPRVVELMHRDGHRLVILPFSGRVVLQVSYAVAALQRPACATRLAEELATTLAGLTPPPPDGR
ncbi:MAG TPA: hypothetical protein ENK23_06635 [Sorangium sp.]|nr:hypothetical protein [Sorangium sp.]